MAGSSTIYSCCEEHCVHMVNEHCSGVDLEENKGVECYLESEIKAAELALATFYMQTFYDFFGHVAIISCHLVPKSVHPVLQCS